MLNISTINSFLFLLKLNFLLN